jgi:hypothetical protein
MGENKDLVQKVKEGLKYHVADTTSLQSMCTPIAAAFETFFAGMSNETSMNARLLGYVLAYGGLGKVYSKGLTLSRRLFKITPETKERVKQLHDAAYGAAYCTLISPPFYYAAGVRDLKQIALGTAASTVLGLGMGGPAGWALDVFRDFTGLKESERLPKCIKNQSKNVKKGLAVLLIAGTIGLTAGVYSLNSALHSTHSTQNISQTNNSK